MSLIDGVKRDREAGTPGPYTKGGDHDWYLETGGENAFFVISGRSGPFAVVAVERAFGLDDRNNADMRRVCRLDRMEAALLACHEALRKIANEPVNDTTAEIVRVDRLATDALDILEATE